VNIDDFATSLTDVWRELSPLVAGARLFADDGAVALATGIPVPTFNGVWLERADPSVAAVAALLDKVAADGAPYSLWLRSGSDGALSELAVNRGMTCDERVPAMVLDATAVAASPSPAGLVIRRLGPGQASVHTQVAAAGFGMPSEHLERVCTPASMELDGVRCYVGELDGQPVTTGLACTLGGRTGLFDIATLPGFRGRGYASAITARAIADGVAAGASWCWLQSSAAGYQVYRNLGFREIDAWQCWLSAA
jgi:N-acetylglutamate synthase